MIVKVTTEFYECDNCRRRARVNSTDYSFQGWQRYERDLEVFDFCGFCIGTRGRQGFMNVQGYWIRPMSTQEVIDKSTAPYDEAEERGY